MTNSKPIAESDTEQQWEALRQSGIYIPKKPDILLQIEELLQSPDFQLSQIADLARKDPGLSARFLHIVNSPANNLDKEVTSVDNAIFILGAYRTLNLCRAIMLERTFDEVTPALEIFWKRSGFIAELTVAITNRQETGFSSDLAYLMGLFHACGVIVLANNIPGYSDALANEETWAHLDDHGRKFGVDHVLVSYLISQHWHLPKIVSKGILLQRGISGYLIKNEEGYQSEEQLCTGLVSSLQLALLMYNRLMLGNYASEWEITREACRSFLNMSEEEFSRFV
ncbi:MAG: HDOD domain-containing protein [Nitrosomonas sp.]|nr:HDOD domain-containing protein [Nitrosomonas sp.]